VAAVRCSGNQVALGIHALLVGDVVAPLLIGDDESAPARSGSRADDGAHGRTCTGCPVVTHCRARERANGRSSKGRSKQSGCGGFMPRNSDGV